MMISRMKMDLLFGGLLFLFGSCSIWGCQSAPASDPPNILFCIADDWGWPHAGAYGDPAVSTPHFDRLAREGILFEHAYVSSPSCTPSRGAILTGQHFWRLGQGANLHSTLDRDLPVFPLLLEEAGYFVGSWRKAWGPGDLEAGGYVSQRPAGPAFPGGFRQFLAEKPEGQPFCFWLGASDPHRPYEPGSGLSSGIDTGKIVLPAFYPQAGVIKSDLSDYYYEVQRFDADVGAAIHLLDSLGALENTIIVVTGDHGMPFPRCKGNLYDYGTRVPLVVRWGAGIKASRLHRGFVSLTDLAPTFLELAGLEVPEEMTGASLTPVLRGRDTVGQARVVFGRERHTPAQAAPSLVGYPSRGIRTEQFLYIRNFYPERWPAGVPEGSTHPMGYFSDCDNGPTKSYLVGQQAQPAVRPFFELSFGKRPAEELYRVDRDPDQIDNLAGDPAFAVEKERLWERLRKVLRATEDPRLGTKPVGFDTFPYRAAYPLNK